MAGISGIDPSVPHQARVWDYLGGGKNNYEADRVAAQYIFQSYPQMESVVRQARAFQGRAVRFLVQEAGVRQFLDVGTGLPTLDHVHSVAQRMAPSCRVVYVDNDPLVQEAEQLVEEGRAYEYRLRTPEQIAWFFEDLEVLEPGVVSVSRWRPTDGPWGVPDEVDAFGGIGFKP